MSKTTICGGLHGTKLDEGEIVSFKELLMANSIQVDTAVQLLIEKGFFSKDEFFTKLKQVQAEYHTRCLKGKICFSPTVKQNLLIKAKIYCDFDELSYDVIHNQILKATIRLLITEESLIFLEL